LVESIKIADGKICGLEYHDRRFRTARRDLFGVRDGPGLDTSIRVPNGFSRGLWKCRVIYAEEVIDVTFEPYRSREIGALRLVACDDIDYRYKYADRAPLERLLDRKEGCDDILIVKHGLVTDTSFSNIAFSDGKGWVTPRSPLLRGTKRDRLVDDGMLTEEDIAPVDLGRFKTASLINAMLDLGDIVIPAEKIYY